jgi:hypothetical protein
VSRLRRLAAGTLLVVVAFTSTACGGGDDETAAPTKIELLPKDLLPASMAGLRVASEDIEGTVKGAKRRSYLDSAGLYSFRTEDDLLQATLQVSRFAEEARFKDPEFRQSVLLQIGSTVPRSFRMDDQTVYLSTGKQQNVVIWFKNEYLFVLSTREEFARPRTLLREAIDLDLEEKLA